MFNNELGSLRQLGRVELTPAVKRMLCTEELRYVLLRHMSSGESRSGSKRTIDALAGCRVLTAYRTKTGGTIFVITEGDRTLTTLLLPEEC